MASAFIDVLVGLWIFMSTFAWLHTVPEFVNTIVCGSLAVLFGLAGLADRRARLLEVVLGFWLVASMHFLAAGRPTLWNNAVCGVALLVGGLLGGTRQRAADPRVRS
jgi:hypothetical protein